MFYIQEIRFIFFYEKHSKKLTLISFRKFYLPYNSIIYQAKKELKYLFKSFKAKTRLFYKQNKDIRQVYFAIFYIWAQICCKLCLKFKSFFLNNI